MNTSLAGGNESRRLGELKKYDILYSAPEDEYADITRLAALICEAPIALISFIDENKQWLKSCIGINISETERAHSFCTHTILYPKEMMVVEDARKDARFQNNPYVAGEPNLVFYAGMPLTNKHGFALGAVCVLDLKPRTLSPKQSKALKLFSIEVMHMLELRRIRNEYHVPQLQPGESDFQSGIPMESIASQIKIAFSNVLKDTVT